MGLLDEAIREHLDLKRRRGADPAEIERAEREALGPVRRGRDPEPALDQPPAYDLPAEPDWEEPFDDEPRETGGSGELSYEPPLSPPERFDPGDESAFDHEPPAPPPPEEPLPGSGRLRAEDPLADDPFTQTDGTTVPRPHPAPEPPDEALGGETVEYRVEDALDAPPEEDPPRPQPEEDVLEETPEFLQDTPDHDRLWFEQRPPKDFDFDG